MRVRRGKGWLVAVLLLVALVLAGSSSFADSICVRTLRSSEKWCTPPIPHP